MGYQENQLVWFVWYGSVAYKSREGYTLGKLKSSNNNRGGSGNWKKNVDNLDEINKGPIATNPDNKRGKSQISPLNTQKDKDRKSTRLNSSHSGESRMPSSA